MGHTKNAIVAKLQYPVVAVTLFVVAGGIGRLAVFLSGIDKENTNGLAIIGIIAFAIGLGAAFIVGNLFDDRRFADILAKRSDDPVGDDLLLTFYVLSGWSVVILGALFSVGILAWQVVGWLQSGDWITLPVASFGVNRVAGRIGNDELLNWAASPESWIGLHTALDWLGVALVPMLIGMILARVFGRFSTTRTNLLEFRHSMNSSK